MSLVKEILYIDDLATHQLARYGKEPYKPIVVLHDAKSVHKTRKIDNGNFEFLLPMVNKLDDSETDVVFIKMLKESYELISSVPPSDILLKDRVEIMDVFSHMFWLIRNKQLNPTNVLIGTKLLIGLQNIKKYSISLNLFGCNLISTNLLDYSLYAFPRPNDTGIFVNRGNTEMGIALYEPDAIAHIRISPETIEALKKGESFV